MSGFEFEWGRSLDAKDLSRLDQLRAWRAERRQRRAELKLLMSIGELDDRLLLDIGFRREPKAANDDDGRRLILPARAS